jgi:hypothetical protein
MITQPPEAINPISLKPIREVCPNRSNSFIFYNHETGEHAKIPCNRYSCPVCGRKKVQRLYAALVKYFEPYKFMRLFTFTISTKLTSTPEEHYKLLSKCFADFFKEIRRCPLLSQKQREVGYVRCIDYHISGYTHYHALFNQYLPIKTCIKIWRHVVQKNSNMSGHVGSVVAVGMLNTKKAASYVCKYVLKAAQDSECRWRRYTKSGKLALFAKHISSGKWTVLLADIVFADTFSRWLTGPVFTRSQYDITPQDFKELPP